MTIHRDMARQAAARLGSKISSLAPLAAGMISAVALSCLATPSLALDNWFWRNTQLINLSDRVPLSDATRSLGKGSYELAGGKRVDFRDWYRRKGISFYSEWRTALSPNLGLLWGFSTGERGEKYAIDPALSLGMHFTYDLSRTTNISMVARTWVWGKFREKTCKADYGQIGGTQKVNCRLAASILPPKDTLYYLAKDRPDRMDLRLQFVSRF